MSDATAQKQEPRMVSLKTLILILTVCLSVPVGTLALDSGIGWRALAVANESMRKTTNVEQEQKSQKSFFTAEFTELRDEMATLERRMKADRDEDKEDFKEFRKEVNAKLDNIVQMLLEK